MILLLRRFDDKRNGGCRSTERSNLGTFARCVNATIAWPALDARSGPWLTRSAQGFIIEI